VTSAFVKIQSGENRSSACFLFQTGGVGCTLFYSSISQMYYIVVVTLTE